MPHDPDANATIYGASKGATTWAGPPSTTATGTVSLNYTFSPPSDARDTLLLLEKLVDHLTAIRNVVRNSFPEGFHQRAIEKQVAICFEALENAGYTALVPDDPDFIE